MTAALIDSLRSLPGLSELLPGRAHALLLSGGPSSRRIAAFVFAEGARRPVAFVKATSEPSLRGGLRLEHERLVAVGRLAACEGGDEHQSLPIALGLVDSERQTMLAQTVLPGRSLAVLLRRGPGPRARTRLVGAAIEWLSRWHSRTAGELRELLDVDRFESRLSAYLPDSASRAGRDELLRRARLGRGRELPGVVGHGDFWAGNLLIERDASRVGIVDWEHSCPAASPMEDLLFFLTTTGFLLPTRNHPAPSRLEGFGASWWGPFGHLNRRLAHRALDGFGLERAVLPALLADLLMDRVDPGKLAGAGHPEWVGMLEALTKHVTSGVFEQGTGP